MPRKSQRGMDKSERRGHANGCGREIPIISLWDATRESYEKERPQRPREAGVA